MKWKVDFYELFFDEFKDYATEVQKEFLVKLEALKEYGPMLGRSHVDTLGE